ncbi:hypothetical protein BDV19DRAFT_360636 [Aspergillus venezuelensis]
MNNHNPAATSNKQSKLKAPRLTCDTCRERKVRCDRVWPKCGRCVRLGEACGYGYQGKTKVI